MRLNYRWKFLLKNLLKGLVALAVLLAVFIILQKQAGFDAFLAHIGQWPVLVYTVFICSELIFGIIPPELFMIWSIQNGAFEVYALDIALLASISFVAGIIGYFLGTVLKRALPTFFNRYVLKYKPTLNKYGGLLILVGAITPVPFSAICMLVGSTNYPFGYFSLMATARFVRFAVYSFVIYQFNL